MRANPNLAGVRRKFILFATLSAAITATLQGAAHAAPAAEIEQRPCHIAAPNLYPMLDSLALHDPGARAIVLNVDGCIAFRATLDGFSPDTPMIGWSMAKTITAMLIGELVQEGRLKLDAPAPIREWHGRGDPRKAVTLRHLLNMASGLRHIEVGDPVEASDTNQVLFVSGTHAMAARAIAAPLQYRPGTRFEYSTLTSIILSEIVTRTLTPSTDPKVRAAAYRRFAQTYLFGPAAVTSAFLEFDGAGTQVGGSFIHMTPDDWGRIGRLLIDGRAQDGTQVIAPEWLAFMKAPSPAYSGYGGQLWLNRPGGAAHGPGLFRGKGPDDAVGMKGHLGQYVIAAQGMGRDGASHDVVLVRLGHSAEPQSKAALAAMGDIIEAILPAAARSPRSR